MSVALSIPQNVAAPIPTGWWHTEAQPLIDAADWDELNRYSDELKAAIALAELMGREDVIELQKARRVIEKRRGELLGPMRPGARHDLQPDDRDHQVHRTTATNYKRIAQAWPILEPHLLEAQKSTEVSQRALLNIARSVLEDPDEPVKSNGQKIPRAKRAKQIAKLAEKGHTAEQISQKLGVSKTTITGIANEYNIALPLAKHHNTVDPNEVVDRVVSSLEVDVAALDLIRGNEAALDRSHIERWVNSLNESLSRLRQLANQLKKELTHAPE